MIVSKKKSILQNSTTINDKIPQNISGNLLNMTKKFYKIYATKSLLMVKD